MTRDQLLDRLQMLADSDDIEDSHIRADDALLNFINDAEITQAYEALARWYA